MKKTVGMVTEEEKDEILRLYERLNGLKELVRIIDNPDNVLYEKLVTDIGATSTRFQQWWTEKSEKYDWESSDEGSWEIDFNTREIFLSDEE